MHKLILFLNLFLLTSALPMEEVPKNISFQTQTLTIESIGDVYRGFISKIDNKHQETLFQKISFGIKSLFGDHELKEKDILKVETILGFKGTEESDLLKVRIFCGITDLMINGKLNSKCDRVKALHIAVGIGSSSLSIQLNEYNGLNMGTLSCLPEGLIEFIFRDLVQNPVAKDMKEILFVSKDFHRLCFIDSATIYSLIRSINVDIFKKEFIKGFECNLSTLDLATIDLDLHEKNIQSMTFKDFLEY